MISPAFFHAELNKAKINFFTGVPDSLLKQFCAYISDTLEQKQHIIAANEGGAVGLAIGHHLATGDIPCVYMQNSGLGNIVNPLLSLVDVEVCNVPMLFLIGWRGEPGVKDEPQHVKQGRVMLAMLEAMEVPYLVLEDEEQAATVQVAQAVDHLQNKGGPFAIVIRKNTFDAYSYSPDMAEVDLKREEAVELVSQYFGKSAAFISTTGMTSRELFEVREQKGQDHTQDFLVIGGMGHASQIALGTALSTTDKKVVCLDGDGAALMHMGSMGINGVYGPENFIHIVINNGAHESVGAQPTVAGKINLQDVAKGCGYASVIKVVSKSELSVALEKTSQEAGPHFIEIVTACGHRKDLGRPTITPEQNKSDVSNFVIGSK